MSKKEYETTYETINGVFKILKSPRKFLLGKRLLDNDEIVHLPVKILKQIIKDAKEDII